MNKVIKQNNLTFGILGLYATRMEFLNDIVDWCIEHPNAYWSDVYDAFEIDNNELSEWEIKYVDTKVEVWRLS